MMSNLSVKIQWNKKGYNFTFLCLFFCTAFNHIFNRPLAKTWHFLVWHRKNLSGAVLCQQHLSPWKRLPYCGWTEVFCFVFYCQACFSPLVGYHASLVWQYVWPDYRCSVCFWLWFAYLLVQHKFSGRLNNYIQLAIRFRFAMSTKICIDLRLNTSTWILHRHHKFMTS